MTAMSATSAQGAPSNATAARTVLLPGSPATYANRAALREMGLRWDPEQHQWHGTTTADRVRILREQLGLEVRCFGTLDPPPRGPSQPRAPAPSLASLVTSARDPTPRPHDSSRTHAEARTIYRVDEEDGAHSRFPEWDVTSGLPDDSCEEDERAEARRIRDLRGRVKAARAVVSATPGLAETLFRDWQKAARFYGRFGITERVFRDGVPPDIDSNKNTTVFVQQSPDRAEEAHAPASTAIPCQSL